MKRAEFLRRVVALAAAPFVATRLEAAPREEEMLEVPQVWGKSFIARKEHLEITSETDYFFVGDPYSTITINGNEQWWVTNATISSTIHIDNGNWPHQFSTTL